MFCENCGKKIVDGNLYCPNCGTQVIKVESNPHNQKSVSLSSSNINNKWWFRFVKVLYVLAYAVVVLVIVIGGYSSKQGGGIDLDKSTITCTNGKSYSPGKNNIYLYSDNISSYDDDHIRILCAYDTLNFYSFTPPAIKNYSFYSVTKPVDWSESWQIWFWGIIITIIVFELIRRTFYYIVLGRKFIKGYKS